MYFVQVRVNRARVYFHEHFIDAHVGVEPAAVSAPLAAFAVDLEKTDRPRRDVVPDAPREVVENVRRAVGGRRWPYTF